jgi:hypothetical protein
MTAIELKDLWTRTLGDSPAPEQFELWLSMHTPEAVRVGIQKTAMKNLQLDMTMTLDRKIRFASKVMLSKTFDKQKAEGQRLQSNPPAPTAGMRNRAQ